MNKTLLAVVVAGFFIFSGCGSSSSSSGTDSDAAQYATFGATVNDAIPAGLKTGGASASIAVLGAKNLTGTCLDDGYTSCPAMIAAGGSDNQGAEIMMRLWGLDYHSECTDAFYQSGMCFQCDGCTDNISAETYIKPTMLESPTSCATTATEAGRYVNFGVDPCFFDAMIGQISNIAACKTTQGGSVDISTAVPWYASWGLDQTINFSSLYARDNGGKLWWTINNGAAGVQQLFLSLDSDWMYLGMKDSVNNKFLFFGTGSPTYYQGHDGYYGVNIAAYEGTLSTIPAQFEAMQVRVQSPYNYIERVTSNGTYLWYQEWKDTDFPSTAAEVATKKDSPTNNRCVLIGTSVVDSKYVPLAECAADFNKDTVEDLNKDDNYALKIIDGETASAINFTTSLTPSTTTTSCLPSAAQ